MIALAIFAGALLVPASAVSDKVCVFGVWEVDLAYTGPPDPTPQNFDSRHTPVASFSIDSGAYGIIIVNVSSFLFQNYSRSLIGGREILTPEGELSYIVRFAPPLVGQWSWVVTNSTGSVLQTGNITSVRCGGHQDYGEADPPEPEGFVRIAKTGQHFVSSNGRSLFLVGQNIALPSHTNGTYAMEHYIDQLYNDGGNAFRMWLGGSVSVW